jgi:hypothetical protein
VPTAANWHPVTAGHPRRRQRPVWPWLLVIVVVALVVLCLVLLVSIGANRDADYVGGRPAAGALTAPS